MNSRAIPVRAVNLGMISLRITGSGEPATTTLPSFFAATMTSFQSYFSGLRGCAHAEVAINKTIATNLDTTYLLDLSVVPTAYSGWTRPIAAIMIFTAKAKLPRDTFQKHSGLQIGDRIQRSTIAFCQRDRTQSHGVPPKSVVGSGTVDAFLKKSVCELDHLSRSLLVTTEKIHKQHVFGGSAKGSNEARTEQRSAQ